VVGLGAIDAVVYAARVKVGFKLLISVQVHASLLPRLGGVTRGKEG
jgi:hypothetical protein